MLNGDEYIFMVTELIVVIFVTDNVIQAILSACAENDEAINQTYNIAVGSRTDLNTLFSVIKNALKKKIIYQRILYLPNRLRYKPFSR